MKKALVFLFLTFSIFAFDTQKKIDFRTNPDDNISSAFLKLTSLSNNEISFTFDKKVNLNQTVNMQFKLSKYIDVLNALTKQNNLVYEAISDGLYLVYNYNDSDYAYISKQYNNIIDVSGLQHHLKLLLPSLEIVEDTKIENSLYVKARNIDFKTIDSVIEEYNKESSKNSKFYSEKYFEFDYQDVKTIVPLMQKYYSFTSLLMDEKNNAVLLRYLKKDEKSISELIKKLDREKSTVLIEVQILEYSKNEENNIGFKWGEKNSIGIKDFSSGKLSSSLSYLIPTTFEFTEIMGNSKILAKPSLLVIDNNKASILVGDQIPIVTSVQRSSESDQLIPQVEYKSVGLSLAITPDIHNNSDKVSLQISLAVNNLGEYLATEFGNYPTITTKSVETNLLLPNKEQIFIGGLISEEERKKTISVPLLGKIPVIGRLFRYEENDPKNTEIILYVKPTIISKADFNLFTELPTKESEIKEENTIKTEIKKEENTISSETKIEIKKEEVMFQELKSEELETDKVLIDDEVKNEIVVENIIENEGE